MRRVKILTFFNLTDLWSNPIQHSSADTLHPVVGGSHRCLFKVREYLFPYLRAASALES